MAKNGKSDFSTALAVCRGAELSDGHLLLLEGEPADARPLGYACSRALALLSLPGQDSVPWLRG